MANIRAATIAHGATVVRPNDTASRRSRIAIAQLYKRYRQARALRAHLQGELGGEHISTREAHGVMNEAWNSLQAMKAILWSE